MRRETNDPPRFTDSLSTALHTDILITEHDCTELTSYTGDVCGNCHGSHMSLKHLCHGRFNPADVLKLTPTASSAVNPQHPETGTIRQYAAFAA